MAITVVTGQETGANGTDAALISVAFPGNVTAGNTIIVVGMTSIEFEPSDPLTSSDCQKIAGTATIGAITLRVQTEVDRGDGVLYQVGIWDAPVTGSGSCTMQVDSSTDFGNCNIAIGEYTSNVGAISFDTGQTNTGTGTGTAVNAGSVTTSRNGIIVGGVVVNSAVSGTITPDAAFTTIFEVEDGNLFFCSSAIRRIVTGSVADAAEWTLSESHLWVGAVAAFVEPAAGGNSSSVSPSVSPSPSPSSSVSSSVSPSVSPSSSVSSSASPSVAPPAFVERTVFVYID